MKKFTGGYYQSETSQLFHQLCRYITSSLIQRCQLLSSNTYCITINFTPCEIAHSHIDHLHSQYHIPPSVGSLLGGASMNTNEYIFAT